MIPRDILQRVGSLSSYRPACAHLLRIGRMTQQIATPAQNNPAIADGLSRLLKTLAAIRYARSALIKFFIPKSLLTKKFDLTGKLVLPGMFPGDGVLYGVVSIPVEEGQQSGADIKSLQPYRIPAAFLTDR